MFLLHSYLIFLFLSWTGLVYNLYQLVFIQIPIAIKFFAEPKFGLRQVLYVLSMIFSLLAFISCLKTLNCLQLCKSRESDSSSPGLITMHDTLSCVFDSNCELTLLSMSVWSECKLECGRYLQNYPPMLAIRLGKPFASVSCKIADIINLIAKLITKQSAIIFPRLRSEVLKDVGFFYSV